MSGKLAKVWQLPQNSWRFLLIIILAIGIFFRFANLDQKVYWIDEAGTSRYISGYTEPEVNQDIFDGRLFDVGDLQKYQYPDEQKTAADVIENLAQNNPEHPPLYFLALRIWLKFFGNSVAAIRSFSAIISLLTFPCIYWLCQELFQSKWVSWTAVALTAISPVHIVYAQEARQYSLWIVMILISSAILLRAIRKKNKINRLLYGVTVSLGLYTHLFFALVAFGHGIYVILTERFKFNRVSLSYLSALLIPLFAFGPWLWILFTQPPTPGIVSWMDDTPSPLFMAIRLAGVISRTFVDLGISPNDSLFSMLLLAPVILILFVLIGYSLYFVFRHSSERVWLFIFTLVGVTSLTVIFCYLILDKQIATTRYLLPVSLGIQLSVAYLLATKLQATPLVEGIWKQRFWRIAIILVSFFGILSGTIRSQSEVWWNQVPQLSQHIPEIAEIVNQSDRAVVISDAIPGVPRFLLYGLSHQLTPEVKLQLFLKSDAPVIKYDSGDVFLFESSEELRTEIETLYDAKAKLIVGSLWQLESSQ